MKPCYADEGRRSLRSTTILCAALCWVLLVAPANTQAQNDSWFTDGTLKKLTPDCQTDPTDRVPPDAGSEITYPNAPDPALVDPIYGPCDSYDYDVLERPTDQGRATYYPAVDIDTTWLGWDSTWIYVGIGLAGFEGSGTDEAPHRYGYDLDVNADSIGDYFFQWLPGQVTASCADGKTCASFAGDAADLNQEVFEDQDGTLGSTYALRFTAEGPSSNNGYECDTWKTGYSSLNDGGGCSSGTDVTDVPQCVGRVVDRGIPSPVAGNRIRVDIACLRSVIGNPALDTEFFGRSWADKGNAGGGNRYFHDVRDLSQYGVAYPPGTTANTYEIDNGGGFCRVAGGADCSAILPVELVGFSATLDDRQIVLSWETASEVNNAGFDVERSLDGSTFQSVAFVEGYGTTDEPRSYSLAVSAEDVGIHRFRLKQVDFDGAFEYSSVIEVAVTVPDRFVLEPAYPNPFNPTTNVKFAVASRQQVTAALYDVLGKEVRVLFDGVSEPNTTYTMSVNAEGLPSGTYIVKVAGDGISASQTIVLAK